MPTNYVVLPDRNFPVKLPNGQTMLIAYAAHTIGVYWFEGSLKTEPVKTKHLNPDDWPGIYTRQGWDLVLLLNLVLTVNGGG